MSNQDVRTISWGAGRTDAGPPMGTNGWARWSAILGVLALFPLGLAFGVVGLVQTSRSGQPGRKLALLGLVASVAWGVTLVSALATSGTGIQRGPDGQVTSLQEASVFDVRPGDCFSLPPSYSTEVDRVELLPCRQSHDGKVFATPVLPYLDGSLSIEDTSKKLCADAAKSLNEPDGWSYMYPEHALPGTSMRRAICYTG